MTHAKSVRFNRKGQLVLPREMRKDLGMKEGDELIITMEDDCLIVTAPENFANATCGILKGTWGDSPEEIDDYIRQEREAW
jgi:AbrB family looped-hinge helix DNA binding protein